MLLLQEKLQETYEVKALLQLQPPIPVLHSIDAPSEGTQLRCMQHYIQSRATKKDTCGSTNVQDVQIVDQLRTGIQAAHQNMLKNMPILWIAIINEAKIPEALFATSMRYVRLHLQLLFGYGGSSA